jgi:hypothetical protein
MKLLGSLPTAAHHSTLHGAEFHFFSSYNLCLEPGVGQLVGQETTRPANSGSTREILEEEVPSYLLSALHIIRTHYDDVSGKPYPNARV